MKAYSNFHLGFCLNVVSLIGRPPPPLYSRWDVQGSLGRQNTTLVRPNRYKPTPIRVRPKQARTLDTHSRYYRGRSTARGNSGTTETSRSVLASYVDHAVLPGGKYRACIAVLPELPKANWRRGVDHPVLPASARYCRLRLLSPHLVASSSSSMRTPCMVLSLGLPRHLRSHPYSPGYT